MHNDLTAQQDLALQEWVGQESCECMHAAASHTAIQIGTPDLGLSQLLKRTTSTQEHEPSGERLRLQAG